MTHAERVPVTIAGVNVGSARINEDGTIELTMGRPNALGREILEHIVKGTVSSLSINPILYPAIDGMYHTRADRQPPLSEFGGFTFDGKITKPNDRSRYLRDEGI